MKERGIIFRPELAQAAHLGTKTQTRRLVKPPPFSNGIVFSRELGDIVCHDDYLPPSAMLLRAGSKKHPYNATQDEWESLCPYGQPGDRLWVRETHARFSVGEGLGSPVPECVAYRATCDSEGRFDYVTGRGEVMGLQVTKWTPAIHMPRWASRTTLEITHVRVERLQDITEEDARAEGVDAWMEHVRRSNAHYHPDAQLGAYPVTAFKRLWESINGAGSWDLNPWVWRIEFRRVTP